MKGTQVETYQIVALEGIDRGTHPYSTDRQEDALLQHRQVEGHPSTTQTGRGMPLYNTDSEQTPGLITRCRTWWGKKAKLY